MTAYYTIIDKENGEVETMEQSVVEFYYWLMRAGERHADIEVFDLYNLRLETGRMVFYIRIR